MKQPLCTDFKPTEQLRVFISSAQNSENGVAWVDIRKRIKDCLSKCIYFNPFIIEDVGSAIPSSQLFQSEVKRTDVIVLLVKGEIRSGTNIEYTLAKKYKKPMIVYFINDDNPGLSVKKLKDEIQKEDGCTYHPLPSFDNIEITIRNDLVNDIIRTFQFKYFVPTLDNEISLQTDFPEETTTTFSEIPTKTELEKFGSCYNYLFDFLDLSYLKNDIEQTVTATDF